jgi:hypothetical protein
MAGYGWKSQDIPWYLFASRGTIQKKGDLSKNGISRGYPYRMSIHIHTHLCMYIHSLMQCPNLFILSFFTTSIWHIRHKFIHFRDHVLLNMGVYYFTSIKTHTTYWNPLKTIYLYHDKLYVSNRYPITFLKRNPLMEIHDCHSILQWIYTSFYRDFWWFSRNG